MTLTMTSMLPSLDFDAIHDLELDLDLDLDLYFKLDYELNL